MEYTFHMFGAQKKQIDRLDFTVIGAQKSGTTALHYLLAKHAAITLGDQQELHFFDDETTFAREPDYDVLHRHFGAVDENMIAGDCTPSYLYWQPAAERIYHYNPRIRLIAILRNPVDRAFAHWNMQRFKKREPLDFLDAVKEERKRIAQPLSLEARRFSYVQRGFYTKQLERFFGFFPREQFMIIKFDDFRNQPQETLNALFRFLGLKPLRHVRSKDRNVVPYEREMRPDERKHLSGIFTEEIDKLEKLLGWDCADWKNLAR